ncbi:MAG: heat-inducible transcription repressor HrcA [Dethiosulfovibrio peptidovorans]|nr:MAG: heat-inducible transcription repressor HrcA [Dethiosulfovibrio peptidovorans]
MLTERQLEIVLSVVYDYISTGEPVGSRTVSKKYIKGCSAATVRNEMADLDEMGYFFQPHTSAGRIPTPLAYRVYVNSIMHRQRAAPPGLELWVRTVRSQRADVESTLSQISRLLGKVTSYLGVAAVTTTDVQRLQKVDLVRLEDGSILVLVVLENGAIRHRRIVLDGELPQGVLDDLAATVNNGASGKSWSQVKEALYGYISVQLEEYWGLCRAAIDRLDAMLAQETCHLSTGRVSQIFNVPDFADIGRIQTLLALVEDEPTLAGMIRERAEDDGVTVTIGTENPHPSMKDCSVVVASASQGYRRSVVGLIGPVRMDYERSISVLEAVLGGLYGDENDCEEE